MVHTWVAWLLTRRWLLGMLVGISLMLGRTITSGSPGACTCSCYAGSGQTILGFSNDFSKETRPAAVAWLRSVTLALGIAMALRLLVLRRRLAVLLLLWESILLLLVLLVLLRIGRVWASTRTLSRPVAVLRLHGMRASSIVLLLREWAMLLGKRAVAGLGIRIVARKVRLSR
jgi:hypothetical protein